MSGRLEENLPYDCGVVLLVSTTHAALYDTLLADLSRDIRYLGRQCKNVIRFGCLSRQVVHRSPQE